MPNYSAGNTKRFKDIQAIDEAQTSPNPNNSVAEIFLYNDHNEKGGRNGLACICLSMVDENGDPASKMAYPVPTSSDLSDYDFAESFLMVSECGPSNPLQDTHEKDASNESRPKTLIQFRIWESGRVDVGRLTALLESSIKQALWDTIIEYRILTEPLCTRDLDEDDDDSDDEIAVLEMNEEQLKVTKKQLCREIYNFY